MFGRIRASPSSVDNLEGSPSKILRDDSFSIYEATLMKLKLGAQRDLSAFSKETDEIINDSANSSSCLEASCIPASDSSFQHVQSSPDDGMMIMDVDCSSISISPSSGDHVSTGTSEQPRHTDVSIIHFFSKFKDSRRTSKSSNGEAMLTENGCPATNSSSSNESLHTSETESIQSSPVCELLE